jgi:hypothetical protein
VVKSYQQRLDDTFPDSETDKQFKMAKRNLRLPSLPELESETAPAPQGSAMASAKESIGTEASDLSKMSVEQLQKELARLRGKK